MLSNPHRFPIRQFFPRRKQGARIAPGALLVLLSLALWPQHIEAATESSVEKPRLVTRGDGLSIIQAISEYRESLPRHAAKPDCSHLVNDVYDLAGFPYPYAKSSDLYAGHSNFVRVNSPQPGDLIVWRGHVGLVTDPREHLFYSSVRSGLDVEDYTSAYWRSHGVPRFYRYRLSTNELLARRVSPRSQSNVAPEAVPVSLATNEAANEETVSVESSAPLDRSSGNSPAGENSRTTGIPASATTIVLGRDKPTLQQVNEAVSKITQPALDAASLLRSPSTLVIFDHIQVERLNLKSKHGLAVVTVASEASLTAGVLDKTARHGEERWEMTRAKNGWTLAAPSGIIYVPRSLAVRLFAQQLARLTAESGSQASESVASQESNLASLLNGLLNN
jgi:NlpC/P60 family